MALVSFIKAVLQLDTKDAQKGAQTFQKQLDQGLNRALGGMANQAGLAGQSLSKLGPIGLTAAAAIGGLTIGLKSLISESNRLVKEAGKLKLSTEQYQKQLGITVPLTEEAVDAGLRLGKTWDNLSSSTKNLALNALAPLAKILSGVTDEFLKAADARKEFDQANLAQGFTTAKAGGSLSGMIDPNTAAALARAGINVNTAPGPKIGTGGPQISMELLARRNAEIEEARKKADEQEKKLAEERLRRQEKLKEFIDKVSSADYAATVAAKNYWERLHEQTREMHEVFGLFQDDPSLQQAGINAGLFSGVGTGGLSDIPVSGRFYGQHLGSAAPGVDSFSFGEAKKDIDSFGLSLEAAAAISQIFGEQMGVFGEALTQGSAAASLITKGLDKGGLAGAMDVAVGAVMGFAAVMNATSAGSQGKRALGGALAGAQVGGAILPGWGHVIGAAAGAIIGWVRGKGPADIMKDAGRDLGVQLSQSLAESIHKSGKPIQLALADIFREGNMSADRFAEEIGDIFSGLQQGAFTKPEAIKALEESIPLLLANFKELGPAGQAEIDRIISAAREMGVEFEGLSALIQLTFAPATVEEMAAAFNMTNEQIQAMADKLGIDVQTNLDRMAASVGLTAEEFNNLGAAMQDQLGIPAEQLLEFMEATGLSAAELAEKLGVDVGEGAQTAADAQEAANENIKEGRDLAAQLANELERAARASGSIDVGGGGGGSGKGAKRRAKGTVTSGPEFAMIGERGPEVVAPVAALFGKLGDSIAAKVAGSGRSSDLDAEILAALRTLPATIGRTVRDNMQKSLVR